MPRQKNTRPTSIYWLYDMRPATVEMFGPEGKPFYCGKTVYDVKLRLRRHKEGIVFHPHRRISIHLIELGEHVRIQITEIVPPECGWAERERHWIQTLRSLNPDCVNISSGGEGAPGNIPGAETRTKMSIAKLGKRCSIEHRAKISAAHLGKQLPRFSPEHCTKLRNAWVKRKQVPISNETREKMRAAKLGKPLSIEHRAKLSISRIGVPGKKLSPEHRAKISTVHRGKKVSDETRAKLRATQIALWADESRAKVRREAHAAFWTDEARAKARASALRHHTERTNA